MAKARPPLTILSRASRLAILQVEEVLLNFPQVEYSLKTYACFGDKHPEIPLFDSDNIQLSHNSGVPSDFFTREIDVALISGAGDLAIHSAKDLPYPLPDDLEVFALTAAKDQTDSLVVASDQQLDLGSLPEGARVGTSSLARQEQLLAIRPDLQIVPIRGTIEERLAQVDAGAIDALIVATCALQRLGLTKRIAQILPFKTHPLQGSLAIVGRRENMDLAIGQFPLAQLDIRSKWGTVYLVGAGPGDPELMTVKGQRICQDADLLFYDDLALPCLETLLNSGAGNSCCQNKSQTRAVYVGKRKDAHSYKQAEINEMLYQAASQGQTVVRLKGGDPFIFGRGGEEYDYLSQRLVKVEVIPGVSAALAAAATSAIPLTERGKSSSVALLTGHPAEQIIAPTVDTLVYYMAGTKLEEVAQKVLASGRAPDTPVAIIVNVSLYNQRVEITTLGEITSVISTSSARRDLKISRYARNDKTFKTWQEFGPALMIIGEVVRHKTAQSWFTRKRKILCTGTDPKPYRSLGEVTHQPLIELKPLADYTAVDELLKKFSEYQWLVLTSKYAVKYFIEHLLELGLDARIFMNCQIASIGNKTSEALRQYGLRADLQAKEESSTGLVAEFAKLQAEQTSLIFQQGKIIIPRSNIASENLPEGLRLLGYKVTTVPIYQNIAPAKLKPLDLDYFDCIAFSSPSAVVNFQKIYGTIPAHLEVITSGPVTADIYKRRL